MFEIAENGEQWNSASEVQLHRLYKIHNENIGVSLCAESASKCDWA